MEKLGNYVMGEWVEGEGEGRPLHNAVNGEVITHAGTKGLDFEDILDHGRKTGGPPLRSMTFWQRARMIKALALHLYDIKDKYYPISYKTGATKADSWFDIDGGIGNLFSYASLRRQFPDQPFHVDGDMVNLSKSGQFVGHHMMVPKEGVAIHINAFNFPIWGMLEKVAVNLLAGVPAVVKPATITSFLTEAMVRDIIEADILPEGALQLVCGSARDLLNHVESQDVVTFTGSASTGKKLKTHPRIIEEAVPFNMEADSLNCSVLGEDAGPDTEEFDLFIKEVHKEMTSKCGQKCTAIRRILVPDHLLEDVQIALGERLEQTTIGDPSQKGIRMGALAGQSQLEEVRGRVKEIMEEAELAYGDLEQVDVKGADARKGAFISPLLLVQRDPLNNKKAHEVEAFGPVSTLMPYNDLDEAIQLSKMGKGSLCTSIATYDDEIARKYAVGAGAYHGRILFLNRDNAKEQTGHGSPLAYLVHGGPGRAGGGEEMGGVRGVKHYLQPVAVQGTPTTLTEVLNVYQPGGTYKDPGKHVFRKYFEELEVGETVITGKRTITETDIINFANVSWDHFYAHVDTTSLEETTFEGRVAHGYFILSAAAGLFVDEGKNPVLLNYGIEHCRFTKPVYPGMTIGVRLTVKEKIDQHKRGDEDIGKGIVKYLVDVYDEEDETVAIATIMTMVKHKDQSRTK